MCVVVKCAPGSVIINKVFVYKSSSSFKGVPLKVYKNPTNNTHAVTDISFQKTCNRNEILKLQQKRQRTRSICL